MDLAVLLTPLLAVPQAPAPAIVFADFEGEDHGGWTATGTAFGSGPVHGALPAQMPVSGYRGRGFVDSFAHGDASTGRLLSPPFVIGRDSIVFRIGGGGGADTCMQLLVDGEVVRSASGHNTGPGGSEALTAAGFDVRDLRGRTARLCIVDAATGPWGHINVDDIVFTDVPPPQHRSDVQREFGLRQRYLRLPVSTGAWMHRVALLVDGEVVREFDVELADDPQWFADLDVDAWRGRKATLRVDWLDGDGGLSLVAGADRRWQANTLHQEALRPQLHFSPPRGWCNDPNGLVWSEGEYHLFYQHNPYGWNWGNMHWGHAVSRDLVHWQDLPIALYPRSAADQVYSGSAVVDSDDTSGWHRGAGELLVAAFTSTGRGECLAYSNDRGRTWTECDANPVLRHRGRDPRLLWHAASRQWVMAVYDETDGGQRIVFSTSPDLRQWRRRSSIDGFFECPDLFALPLDGDAGQMLWVLTAASSDYRIGSFDAAVFTPQTPMLRGHRGRGFYAAQTFSREPRGRRVQIGWLQASSPGMPFNQAMSLPHELRLRRTADGPRLCWLPVTELTALRQGAAAHLAGSVDGERVLLPAATGPLELRAVITPGRSSVCGIELCGVRIAYDVARGELEVAGVRAPLALPAGGLDLIAYLDTDSVEVFAAGGMVYMPVVLDAAPRSGKIALFAQGGEAGIDGELHLLRGIW